MRKGKVKVKSKIGWLRVWAQAAISLGWRNSATCCMKGAGGPGLVWAGGPKSSPPTQGLQQPPGPHLSWSLHELGSLGCPEWAWSTLLHPSKEALSKGFQWPLPFSATLPGGVLEESLLLCSGSQYWAEGWELSDQCPTCWLCGLGQLTYPLCAPDPSGRRKGLTSPIFQGPDGVMNMDLPVHLPHGQGSTRDCPICVGFSGSSGSSLRLRVWS